MELMERRVEVCYGVRPEFRVKVFRKWLGVSVVTGREETWRSRKTWKVCVARKGTINLITDVERPVENNVGVNKETNWWRNLNIGKSTHRVVMKK